MFLLDARRRRRGHVIHHPYIASTMENILFLLPILSFFLLIYLPLPAASFSHSRGDGLDGLCSAILHPLGYPCIEYSVITDDGFVLGVQRIPHGRGSHNRNTISQRPPVFLQHGLFQAGDTWFENTPEESLGFLLADAGFDVWVGNVRGTRWSHGHVTIPMSSKEFWVWSWDELAEKDLPAMLELAYNVTMSQIFYVGHSQGTLIAFAALTEERVAKMIAAVSFLSPITFLSNITAPFIRAAVNLQMDKFIKHAGIHQLNLRSDFAVKIADQICASSEMRCDNLLTSITGPNCCFNDSRIPYYLKYEPHPSSTRNIEHFFQMIRKGTFSKFDYGALGNLMHYGSPTAPTYNLSRIPKELPAFIAFGGKDALADVSDVFFMLGKLLCNVEILYLENYAHLDFVLSTSGKADLYEKVIDFFRSQMQTSDCK